MLTVIEYADTPPVALADVKAHLGIEHNLDDDRLTALIWAAVEYIEQTTGKSFAAHTYKLTLPKFDTSKPIRLPRYPVQGVLVEYYDSTNEEQTLDEAEYLFLNPTNQQPEIYPVYPVAFPVTYPRPDAVNITFMTGIEDTPSITTLLPPLFVTAVKLIVGYLNENREGQAKDVEGIDRILGLLRDGGYH